MKLTSQTSGSPLRLKKQCRTANGLRLHAWVATANCAQPLQPFVLLPGLGMSHCYFVPLARQLATHADVYALDLPGHGRSESGPLITHLEQWSDTLEAWLRVAGLPQAVLVGNSLGAQIAVDCALRFPQRICGLALLGATLDPRAHSLLRLLVRMLRTGLHEKASLFPLLAGDYLRALPRLVAEYRLMLADKIDGKLSQLRMPLLLLRGENDFISPADWTRQLCDKSLTAQVVTVPEAAHAVHFSKPMEVADTLLTFFNAPAMSANELPPNRKSALLATRSDR